MLILFSLYMIMFKQAFLGLFDFILYIILLSYFLCYTLFFLCFLLMDFCHIFLFMLVHINIYNYERQFLVAFSLLMLYLSSFLFWLYIISLSCLLCFTLFALKYNVCAMKHLQLLKKK